MATQRGGRRWIQVNLHEAKTQLSKLVARAEAGEEVVIARDGKPVVRLVPITAARTRRQTGRDRGRIVVPEDFDAPLPAQQERLFEA